MSDVILEVVALIFMFSFVFVGLLCFCVAMALYFMDFGPNKEKKPPKF